MKILAISDTHFGHEKLIEYGRPDNFSQKILMNLGNQKGDLLIHCGDFCIGNDEEWSQLFMNAAFGFKKKILVRGNHDGKSDHWYYSRAWDFVCREVVIQHYGKKILFTHKPLAVENRGALDLNIHGHLHGKGKDSHRMVEGGMYDDSFHFDLAPDIRDWKASDISKI